MELLLELLYGKYRIYFFTLLADGKMADDKQDDVSKPEGTRTTSTTRETTKEMKDGVMYTKTITKETVENEDGTKKVVTREVITTDQIADKVRMSAHNHFHKQKCAFQMKSLFLC